LQALANWNIYMKRKMDEEIKDDKN